MSSRLVDFHCHLDLFPDFESAVNAADSAEIYTLAVTTTPLAWPRNYTFTKDKQYVRSALGLHPQLVSERANELSLWEKYFGDAKYIGEIGLDAGPAYYNSFDLQKRVFKRILECCAESGGKVLSVHSTRSASIVLSYIEKYLPPDRGKVVLHWFNGSVAEARRALELGCVFSINAKMVSTKNGKDLVTILPLDRILTETDNPFTHDNLYNVIKAIAANKNLNCDEVESIILKNVLPIWRESR